MPPTRLAKSRTMTSAVWSADSKPVWSTTHEAMINDTNAIPAIPPVLSIHLVDLVSILTPSLPHLLVLPNRRTTLMVG